MSSVRTQLNCYMFLSGYTVTLMTLPVKTPPDILLHDSHTAVRLWLLLDNSWVTRPSFSLLWSSSSSHLPSIRLPPSLSPSFVSFSLPVFFHSLSGRATRGSPSQPNPEPTGTRSRGSSGCNSEWLKSNQPSHLVWRGGKQCSRALFNQIENLGHAHPWEVSLLLVEMMPEKISTS